MAIKGQKATRGISAWTRTLRLAGASAVSGVFMAPALVLNFLSLGTRGPMWVFISVALVIGGAYLMHEAKERRDLSFRVAACVVVFMSMFTAVRSIGGYRQSQTEARTAASEAKTELGKKRGSLETRRKVQANVAGEDAPKVIEARIDALKAKSSYRWTATEGCTANIDSREAKSLCGQVTDLQGQKAAAEERDRLQGELDRLDTAPAATATTPALGADNSGIIHILAIGGAKADSADVDDMYEVGIVLALELLAAMMPAAVFARAANAAPVQRKTQALGLRPLAKAATVGEPKNLVAEFAMECTEPAGGEYISNDDIFPAWDAFLTKRGVDPKSWSRRAFQTKMKLIAPHENNSNRPRYVGVRLKARHGLSLVVNN